MRRSYFSGLVNNSKQMHRVPPFKNATKHAHQLYKKKRTLSLPLIFSFIATFGPHQKLKKQNAHSLPLQKTLQNVDINYINKTHTQFTSEIFLHSYFWASSKTKKKCT